jgi:hypothetical protein
VTGYPVAAICRALRIARQTAYYVPAEWARGHYRRAADGAVLQQIHPGFDTDRQERRGAVAGRSSGSLSLSKR